jgi:hypothetical protein
MDFQELQIPELTGAELFSAFSGAANEVTLASSTETKSSFPPTISSSSSELSSRCDGLRPAPSLLTVSPNTNLLRSASKK